MLCFATANLRAGDAPSSARQIRFVHIGPEDASIPPFAVAVGDAADSTFRRVLVNEPAYRAIATDVIGDCDAPPRTPRAPGTFEATVADPQLKSRTCIVYPETMFRIVDRLRTAFESEKVPLPDALVKLETQLRAARR